MQHWITEVCYWICVIYCWLFLSYGGFFLVICFGAWCFCLPIAFRQYCSRLVSNAERTYWKDANENLKVFTPYLFAFFACYFVADISAHSGGQHKGVFDSEKPSVVMQTRTFGTSPSHQITSQDITKIDVGGLHLDRDGTLMGNIYNGNQDNISGFVLYHVQIYDVEDHLLSDRTIRQEESWSGQNIHLVVVKTGIGFNPDYQTWSCTLSVVSNNGQ